MPELRVMHYINQFFAGIGGEDKADVPVGSQEGLVGPGKRLQELIKDYGEIVVTAYCGDDYFNNNVEEATGSIVKIARDHKINLLVAGPAFASGRYGYACAEVCHAVNSALGIDCVMAMHPQNPGIETYRQYRDRKVFALATTEIVSGMGTALTDMANFVSKLAAGTPIGAAADFGYIPRGFRQDELVNKSGIDRAVDMLLDKIAGRPFLTEIPVERLEAVKPAPRIVNIKKAVIALGTSGGIMPRGNPDGFKAYRNTQWRKYDISKLNTMKNTGWDVLHAGYNNVFMRDNPNYGVPLDAARQLEKEGEFGKLFHSYYMTTGVNAAIPVMQRIGKEMVADMKAQGIDGVIFVST